MIDPLTITGAAAGSLALAEACFKTAILFYEFSFSNSNEIALDELYRFYLNLRSFSGGIELAHMELRRHCKAHSDSPPSNTSRLTGSSMSYPNDPIW